MAAAEASTAASAVEASSAASAIEASVAASLTEGSVAASPTEGSVAASATDTSMEASTPFTPVMAIAATAPAITDTPATATALLASPARNYGDVELIAARGAHSNHIRIVRRAELAGGAPESNLISDQPTNRRHPDLLAEDHWAGRTHSPKDESSLRAGKFSEAVILSHRK